VARATIDHLDFGNVEVGCVRSIDRSVYVEHNIFLARSTGYCRSSTIYGQKTDQYPCIYIGVHTIDLGEGVNDLSVEPSKNCVTHLEANSGAALWTKSRVDSRFACRTTDLPMSGSTSPMLLKQFERQPCVSRFRPGACFPRWIETPQNCRTEKRFSAVLERFWGPYSGAAGVLKSGKVVLGHRLGGWISATV
jgi:hypothetical protein